MNEGLINLVDDDSSQDVQGVPPPPPSRRPAHSQAAAGLLVPPPRQSSPQGHASPGGMLYPSEPPTALPRTSWWRSLIASTVAPPQQTSLEDSAERRIGRVCVGLSLGFAFAALVVGLRSAPADSAGVAVAIVTSRTIISLGILGFGYALLRMGERFLSAQGVQAATKSDE